MPPLPPRPGAGEPPSVFDFQDYRKFLADWLGWKKRAVPSYSGARFARRAGLNSHTLLGMVIRAQRNLSYRTIQAFGTALALRKREGIYFEKLVLYNQAKTPEDRARHFGDLVRLARGDSRNVLTRLRDHVDLLSHWYHVAIREMVGLQGFDPDPGWISAKLKNRINRKQAQEAWDTLLRLGLVREIREGEIRRYEAVHPSIDLEPGTRDQAVRSYHREILERTIETVENGTTEERELSSVTVAVSEEDLAHIKERIREFRRQLVVEYPLSPGPRTKVVAISTQALILAE